MKSGTRYEQGEIVLAPYPFTNLEAVKKRPVLILSKDNYNDAAQDIITCGITSNLENSDNSVLIDNNNLISGSIPLKSRIKVDKIFTLEKSILMRKLAKIDSKTFEKVKNELFKLI